VKNLTLIGACLLALLPADVSAQGIDGGAQPRFIFGPLGITPKFAIKDFGVDTNPSNSPDGGDRDLTFTVSPGVDTVLRVGRGRLSGKTTLDYVYFNESESLRSFNINQDARAEVVLNRLSPFVTGAYLHTRQRPNLEIDERVQQNTRSAGAGVGVRLGSRTKLEAEGRQTRITFGEGTYGDPDIAEALDRDSDVYGVTTAITLTPLTTFLIRGERNLDRFVSSPVRDSDSVTILPGFNFKPAALISGKVMVGYRHFDARDASVPDFGGLVGEVDASYTWREQTRFGFKANRSLEYSTEDFHPYFVVNSGGVELTQSIGVRWFAAVRGGRARLVYRDFVSPAVTSTDEVGRSERVDTYGLGFGRVLRSDLRVGVDLNYTRRTSTEAVREYDGYRVGVSISYGS
jgi:hypothetical protein